MAHSNILVMKHSSGQCSAVDKFTFTWQDNAIIHRETSMLHKICVNDARVAYSVVEGDVN